MARIAVVGNATRDLNKTGLIAARRPGGTLLYASLALHALGHDVQPVGWAPLRAYVWMQRSGLELADVRLAFPGTQFLNQYEEQQRTQWARRGPKHALHDPGALEGAEAVLFGPVLEEVPATVEAPHGVVSLLDIQGIVRRLGEPNLWGWKEVSITAGPIELPRTSHVRGSIEETGPLTSTTDPGEAARVLHDETGRPAIVTAGAGGAVAFDGELHCSSPEPLDVDDPTGAGDVFDAGLLHGLIAGQELDACLAMGCAAASLFIEAAEDKRPRERFAGREAVEKRAGELLKAADGRRPTGPR